MASSSKNVSVIFRQYVPSGLPVMGEHFTVDQVDEPPPIGEGEVLARLVCVSVDPYLRGKMKDVKSYFPPFKIGEPGVSGIVVKVLESKSAAFLVGLLYVGYGSWSLRQVLSVDDLKSFIPTHPDFPPSYGLGVLGMPGLTAYAGGVIICEPKEGETFVVSGAAGAVGAIVCQLAKIKGCRVVGIAGSDEKCSFLREIGCDATIDYKRSKDLVEAVKNAAPNGVDCYFDNVSGPIKDAVYANMNKFARVAACGAISEYNSKEGGHGRVWDWQIITLEWKIQGFLANTYRSHFPEYMKQMGSWLGEGKIQARETKAHGLENVVLAFNDMMSGANIGKMIVYVD